LFESEFLSGAPASQAAYCEGLVKVTAALLGALPSQPYGGKDAAGLTELLVGDVLPNAGTSLEDTIERLCTVVKHSVSVTHPNSVAHLQCPPLIASLLAENVICALNQSMDSFDQAPAATVVEESLVRWLCGEMGLTPRAGGTFTTGGTQSNFMGLLLARDSYLETQWNWCARKKGLPVRAENLRILCSEVAHFTVEKSACHLGLGTDSVVRVAVDDDFRMAPEALREALEDLQRRDLAPFAVVATAGSTDFGSIDPLPEIVSMARMAGAWVHVDAAYGGALLFSPRHRDHLRGIENADSVSMDFHKLFWQPISCGAFLLGDRAQFRHMALHADYLNPEIHSRLGIPNLVTHSMLTTRRFDALKLWVSLQVLGRDKLGRMIDRTLALATHAAGVIRQSPCLELFHKPTLGCVVFSYRPSKKETEWDAINWHLRQRLFERGIAVIGHTRVRGTQCLKLTCMNPSVSEEQITALLEQIIVHGQEVERQASGRDLPPFASAPESA
jgi:L-2,4-diaminobutyrate decarboxylase